MGMLDNVKDKADDMMNDPNKREELQRMAKEKGISMEEAKQRFMNKSDSQQ